jgi:hypothetical protein
MPDMDADPIERIGVLVLPDGSLDRWNASRFLGRSTKTLAQWKMRGKGPPCTRDAAGRCWYQLSDLVAFKAAGKAVALLIVIVTYCIPMICILGWLASNARRS